ncbi:helix-turn-helix domain-containing protein [Enterococcus sp. LJL99]
MPSIAVGREKVNEYMEDNNISITDLSVAYGIKKQDLASYLSGKLETVKGNQVILRIIADYRIR